MLINSFKFNFLLFLGVFLFGCNQEEEPREYLARVKKSALTKDELAVFLDTSNLPKIEKNKFIRNWVELELLYQYAKKEKIENTQEFKYQELNNRKKLAVALFLAKYFKENQIQITESEIKDYYNNKIDELMLPYNVFKVNQILINDLNRAIDFRNALIENVSFKSAVIQKLKQEEILDIKQNYILKEFENEIPELINIINNMQQGEVSFPIQIGENKYVITQLIDKYVKGNIPSLEFVKEIIIERLTVIKQKELYKSLIENLSSNSEIEIKENE